jgi:hypothetical protein
MIWIQFSDHQLLENISLNSCWFDETIGQKKLLSKMIVGAFPEIIQRILNYYNDHIKKLIKYNNFTIIWLA